MKFAERLTETLSASPYTQKQLAEMLGLQESNISNWKKGINLPSVEVLYRLCIILHESADYLLGLDDAEEGK